MRLWAGISAISATLQRRVWTHVKAQKLYANTYVLLCGPPGVGKGNAMKILTPWLREIEQLHIAPDGLTRRSFYSALENSPVNDYNFEEGAKAEDVVGQRHFSMTAFIEELGVFMQPGDNQFVYALCHVYDTPLQLHYKTEHAGENFIENAWFSMLSAVTPKGLKDIFTDQALELGISARTVIIYSDEKIKVDIFGVPDRREQLEKELRFDLNRMTQIQGAYNFSEEAAEQLVAWSETGFSPIPKDPRFEHYNTRRFVQIVKLCMICAAAKRQDTVILPDDIAQAKTFILEAEQVMSGAVQTLGANPYLSQQQLAIRLVNIRWQTQMKGTSEAELRQKIGADMDPRYSDMLLADLEKAAWLDCTGKSPFRIFYPRGKMVGASIEKAPPPELMTGNDDAPDNGNTED
jgi:hypothetical protein